MAIFEKFKRHHFESLIDEDSLLHEFSGILIKSLANREITSWVVKNGIIAGRYEPELFKGYDISSSIDLTEEITKLEDEDTYGSGAWHGKVPFVYKDRPFTGMAYWFNDSSNTPEYHRELLLKDGHIVAEIAWEKGVLVDAYHNGRGEDLSLNYFSQRYNWIGDVSESIFDGELFHAGFARYNLTTRDPPLIPDLEVKFDRIRGNDLSCIKIEGSLEFWEECINQAAYWPYYTLESLFSAWECSDKYFIINGNAFDDNLWRLFIKFGRVDKINIMYLTDVYLTEYVIDTFGAFSSLRELSIKTKYESTKILGMRLKKHYPDINIIVED